MTPIAMKRPGKNHHVPYETRLAAVNRYLTGDESAAEVAAAIGVSEPTMRRYIRDLRGFVASPPDARN